MSSVYKSSTLGAWCLGFFLIAAPLHATELNAPLHARKPSPYYPPYPPTTATDSTHAATIARGEYLIKMGDCISCHTNYKENGASFAGGLPIATPFGTFYSPNITPDKKTGIGTWTEDDFIHALKHGKNPQGQFYFPVFPYVYFANMTDDDVRDMYTYMMSIPAVEQKNKPLPFPFSIPGARLSLLGWDLLFFYPNSPFANDPEQTAEWNRGRYIVDSLGHCSLCHTPLNALGSPKKRFYLSGGFIDGYWAPNISREGLKSASVDEVTRVFSEGQLINLAGPVQGPMTEVNHNSLMYLTPEDHVAMAVYLKSVVNEDPLYIEPSDAPPSLGRGQQVYHKVCVICHQEGAMSAPLIGSAPSWFSRLKDSDIDTLYRHVINGYNSMPVRGACVSCSDNDIKSAVDYILDKSLTRSQWLDVYRPHHSSPTTN